MAEGKTRWWRQRRWWVAAGASAALVGLIFLDLLVAFTVPKTQADLRGNILGLLTPLAALIVGAAALLNFQETRRQNVASLKVTERGQVTDRFTKAIDQLGQSAPDKLDVRLGGIYALEQIARDSPELHWPIIEILTAFIREHTNADASIRPKSEQPKRDQESAASRKVAADIQAALAVLGRRNSDSDRGPVDLSGADLRGVHLDGANLQAVWLGRANLWGAHLHGANLQGADLVEANLQGMRLDKANLQGATLREANLRDAELVEANLQGAVLIGADLHGADLRQANLEGAVGLTQEQLDSAICDGETKPRRS